MSTRLILTLSIFEVGSILDFVQFGIMSIRDFVPFGILLFWILSNLGFCPFGTLSNSGFGTGSLPNLEMSTPGKSLNFIPTIDYLLVDWKLAVLSFISSRFIFLEYDDSSNQRDFFLGSLALRICPLPNQISRISVTAKQLATRTNFFSARLFQVY